MRTAWALGLAATAVARLNMLFYSAELDDDLVVSTLPNSNPIREPTELQVVDNVVELRKVGGQSLSAKLVQAIRAAAYQAHADEHGLSKRVC